MSFWPTVFQSLLGFLSIFLYNNFKITFIFCWLVLQWKGYVPLMLLNRLLDLRSILQLPILTELCMATDVTRDACMYRSFAFVFYLRDLLHSPYLFFHFSRLDFYLDLAIEAKFYFLLLFNYTYSTMVWYYSVVIFHSFISFQSKSNTLFLSEA